MYLNDRYAKYIGAIVQCDMLGRKVREVGDCAGNFNKTTGKIIMQYYAKAQHGPREAQIRTDMSNAWQRIARPGTHYHRAAIDT